MALTMGQGEEAMEMTDISSLLLLMQKNITEVQKKKGIDGQRRMLCVCMACSEHQQYMAS